MSDDKIKNIDEIKKDRFSFGYEDVKNDIEVDIFGLTFKYNLYNTDHFNEIRQGRNLSLKEQVELMIGDGAIEKINKKRAMDNYPPLAANEITQIISFLINTYQNQLSNNILNGTIENLKQIKNRVKNIGNEYKNITNEPYNGNRPANRAQRRYNERYNRRNNNRRYY